jgi:hypothetical protein
MGVDVQWEIREAVPEGLDQHGASCWFQQPRHVLEEVGRRERVRREPDVCLLGAKGQVERRTWEP